MSNWTLDDIPWQDFDPAKADPRMISLAKAAAMVEHNGHDYARYLCEVFTDDPEFQQVAHAWAEEEVQHGQALRRWAELADPSFNFDKSFKAFTDGYKLPTNVAASVRGSCGSELIARCVVEVGTSSYYSAMKDRTDEPVLKAICAKIAADEFRHYKLFYTHFKRYQEKEKLSLLKRARIALGRVIESEDDELAYAFYAAHDHALGLPYARKEYTSRYLACAYPLYRRQHVARMISMVWKAIGAKSDSLWQRGAEKLAWTIIHTRGKKLEARYFG